MEIKPIKKKLKLFGFNNLTKTLTFNLYDICYAKDPIHRKAYIEYIDEQYNSKRLTDILKEVARIIDANILNIANQDYDPQGASVTMLVAENKYDEKINNENKVNNNDMPGPLPDSVVTHLDKSHITVHTYPESHPDNGISTFRADIEVSTCGIISPLKALNYLLHCFNPDIAIIDYFVRGFTRDVNGDKFFIDHKMQSIQKFIAKDTKELYNMVDVNIYQENIYCTKMILKEFDLDDYLFGTAKKDLLPGEKKKIKQRIKKEMAEIFAGRRIKKHF